MATEDIDDTVDVGVTEVERLERRMAHARSELLKYEGKSMDLAQVIKQTDINFVQEKKRRNISKRRWHERSRPM